MLCSYGTHYVHIELPRGHNGKIEHTGWQRDLTFEGGGWGLSWTLQKWGLVAGIFGREGSVLLLWDTKVQTHSQGLLLVSLAEIQELSRLQLLSCEFLNFILSGKDQQEAQTNEV